MVSKDFVSHMYFKSITIRNNSILCYKNINSVKNGFEELRRDDYKNI